MLFLGYDYAAKRRHISLVPHFEGLEALCGTVLEHTRGDLATVVLDVANCVECRAIIGSSVSRRSLLQLAPPRADDRNGSHASVAGSRPARG